MVQKPLSEVTGGRKNAKIEWTDQMRISFDRLKDLIIKNIELAFPCYEEGAFQMELYVDASLTGAGAYLQQKQSDQQRVIAYSSMSFNKAERNYSTIDLSVWC